jgi:hypothetical protein
VVGASEGGLRKSTSVTSVCLFQTLGEAGSELDTPETDRFVAYGYTALGQQIFNISMAKVEPVVEPDCVADDIWRESVPLVGIHPGIISRGELTSQYPGQQCSNACECGELYYHGCDLCNIKFNWTRR